MGENKKNKCKCIGLIVLFFIIGFVVGKKLNFKECLDLLKKLNEAWAIFLSALIATAGVSITIYFQRKSDNNRNIVEYITNSRIEWSYKVRETVSSIVKLQKDIDILVYEIPLEKSNKKNLYAIEEKFKKKQIELKYWVTELTLLLNPVGSIDQSILGWVDLLTKNNNNIYEAIRNTPMYCDGSISTFKSEIEEYKLNDLFISNIINLTQLYLKLEWERVKKEINKDAKISHRGLIGNVFKNINTISYTITDQLYKSEYNEKESNNMLEMITAKIKEDEKYIIVEYDKYFNNC